METLYVIVTSDPIAIFTETAMQRWLRQQPEESLNTFYIAHMQKNHLYDGAYVYPAFDHKELWRRMNEYIN